ncbi:hypothetical protein MKD49_00235 [Herbaspirillum sp. WGmk3]|uniref:DUF6575 domain-containing protein n=1 Tax=Herbaspirillum sp. WGmk3 TaxID=2919925 RepID=UPI002090B520|nr:DUF6575 domain-containing protein [Herbaspirillum sp. WGmk3]MCO4854904.1 hypothetical protein [Herbaspirillum sp. WGmk3]
MKWLPSNPRLGSLQLGQVIEHYDFPRIFTCANVSGQTYIAVSTYDDDEEYDWLFLSISKTREDALGSGELSLYNAFKRPEDGYVVQVKVYNEGPDEVEYLLPDQISDSDLPSPDYLATWTRDVARSADDETTYPARTAAAIRRETFNYRIYPDNPNTHEIPSRKLGAILTSTQELIDALGQSSTGNPTIRGPLPTELLQKTRVNVAKLFHGSFGVQFRAGEPTDLLDESVVSAALEEFANVIGAADAEDLLSNKLHALKGRVTSKYRRLLKELSDIESGLVFDWGSVSPSKGGTFKLSAAQIRQAYEIVDRIDIELAEEVVVRSKLIGYNSRTKRYELRSAEEDKTYSGKVSDNAQIPEADIHIGAYYNAHLRMLVETQSTSGDELVRWVLAGLTKA